MNYYKFTENNEWEGETWHFYLPLTGEQHAKLGRLIAGERGYKLADRPTPESEVDVLHKNASVGYMHTHNKCTGMKPLPETVNFDEDDPFYKGGPWIISTDKRSRR